MINVLKDNTKLVVIAAQSFDATLGKIGHLQLQNVNTPINRRGTASS